MPETDQATAHSTSSRDTTANAARTARKSSAAKAMPEDWPGTIRQSLGAGMTMLGELLVQAGKDLVQPKTESSRKKRRKHATTQH